MRWKSCSMLDHIAPIHEKSINTILRINLLKKKNSQNEVQMYRNLGNNLQIHPNKKVHAELLTLVGHVSIT